MDSGYYVLNNPPCMHACCLLQTEPFDICLLFAICCLLQLSNVQIV
ncbi:hypothetical protein ACN38_g9247, partial [Penicillium nordicum]